jgi:phenylacetate-coenzyme A ligase PaaK-like adenylate-forming protein
MGALTSLSRYVFHPLWDWKDGSSRLKYLRTLERTQWRSLEENMAEQQRRLREQATHAARNVPHYAQVFARAGVDPASLTLETLRRLPILTKTRIRELGPQLIAVGFDPARLKFHKTGGSTGVALQTFF